MKETTIRWSGILLGMLTLFSFVLVLAAGGFELVARPAGGGSSSSGGYSLQAVVGQPEAGQLSGGAYRINGGVIGERLSTTPHLTATAAAGLTQTAAALTPTASAPSPTRTPKPGTGSLIQYMPLVLRGSQLTPFTESEPNNLVSSANPVEALPARISGQHDGTAGTGDVFRIELEASQVVDVVLETEDDTGVQLLAYGGEDIEEITRDFTAPYELHFVAVADGTYYLYVYTPAGAQNSAGYWMTVYVE